MTHPPIGTSAAALSDDIGTPFTRHLLGGLALFILTVAAASALGHVIGHALAPGFSQSASVLDVKTADAIATIASDPPTFQTTEWSTWKTVGAPKQMSLWIGLGEPSYDLIAKVDCDRDHSSGTAERPEGFALYERRDGCSLFVRLGYTTADALFAVARSMAQQ